MTTDKKKDSKCFNGGVQPLFDWSPKPNIAGLVHDPMEKEEPYRSIEAELEEKLTLYFEERSGHKWVSCFDYWDVKKKMLKDDYQLEWKSPVELNPCLKR